MKTNLPPEIEKLVKRRHKTRFLRQHGGMIATFVFLLIAFALIVHLVMRELDASRLAGETYDAPVKLRTKKEAQSEQMPVVQITAAQAQEQPRLASSIKPATGKAREDTARRDAMSQWDDAAKAIEGFFAAGNVMERLAWVTPTRDVETRLRDYEKRAASLPWLGRPEKVGPKFVLQGNYLITTVSFAGQKPRHIALERTTLGWRVDWESYVGYCERPLREIAADEKSDEAFEVRAEAYRVNPPPPGFPADQYLALMLRHPDDGTALQAVVPRKMLDRTPAGKTLAEMLPGRYTLRLKSGAHTPDSNGWAEVAEVICPGWVPRLYATSQP
jgi:hypothetical protein